MATGNCVYTLEQLGNLSHEITPFYTEPDKYLEPTDTMRTDLLAVSKKLYDFMKDFEIYTNENSSLNELLVSGFDNEQIWQEIQLQNTACLPKFKHSLKDLAIDSTCLNEKEKASGKDKKIKKGGKNKKGRQIISNNNEEEEENSEDNESVEGEGRETQTRKKYKSTVVDDNFFQLRQMEECLDQLDQEMNDDDDDRESKGGDMFEDSSDEEEGRGTFEDFFDPPTSMKCKAKNNGMGDGEENKIDGSGDEIGEDDDDVDVGDLDVGDLDDGDDDGDGDIDGDNDVDGDDADADDVDDNGDDDDDGDGDGDGDDDDDDEDEDEDDEDPNEEIDFNKVDESITDPKDGDDIDIQEENGETTIESTFERKQKQMQKKIKKLEEENLSEKPWQLMGEAVAKKRPMNSLLEEFVTFDHTSVGAPTITEDTTLSLEDIIKQRIKDQAWDDVIRKEKPVIQPFEYKKAPELNQEKSKISLAEVYEKEYLKQTEEEKEDKENEEHVNIQKLMDSLFVQLDALSNFHFTPKPPQPEIKIITNVPSLQMEEVLPITMTEASQLAPEEVLEKKRGGLVGDEERTEEDRKRERRQKKIKKKFAAKAREKKEKSGKVAKSKHKQAIDSLKKGVRNTIVNSKTTTTEKSVKGSNDFFDKLQDEVKKKITKETSKGKVVAKTKKSAEFLKL